ncbi:MAG: hypothetical protein M3Y87_35710 [Myxococcota bacterium]|nr:hypothetical protein [Myxococcota bacterium]
MATRGNRPKDPADTLGGVRGTHGLGDAPRRREPSVATQGGTASVTGGSKSGDVASESHVGVRDELPAIDHDEATGEEHGFEMSSAVGELESNEERARRRERDARAALGAADAAADDEPVLGDMRTDEEERRERGLATEKTHGPGPKDQNAGRARVKHLEDHGLKR